MTDVSCRTWSFRASWPLGLSECLPPGAMGMPPVETFLRTWPWRWKGDRSPKEPWDPRRRRLSALAEADPADLALPWPALEALLSDRLPSSATSDISWRPSRGLSPSRSLTRAASGVSSAGLGSSGSEPPIPRPKVCVTMGLYSRLRGSSLPSSTSAKPWQAMVTSWEESKDWTGMDWSSTMSCVGSLHWMSDLEWMSTRARVNLKSREESSADPSPWWSGKSSTSHVLSSVVQGRAFAKQQSSQEELTQASETPRLSICVATVGNFSSSSCCKTSWSTWTSKMSSV